MSRQMIFRTPTSVQRRQPLLQSGSSSNSFCSSSTDDGGSSSSTTRSSSRNSAKFGEFCGGTTAECAVICCCCPCTIANLLVLAFYKVPAGLCRRALRLKRRRKLKEKGLLQPKNHRPHCGIEDNSELQIHTLVVEDFFPDVEASEEAEKAVMELEKRCGKDSMVLDFGEVLLREKESHPESNNFNKNKNKQFPLSYDLGVYILQ